MTGNCACEKKGETEAKDKEFLLHLQENKNKKEMALQVLHKTQELFGYLPREKMEKIAEELRISKAEIYGVASFYSYFSFRPRGKNLINVCLGTACYVKGAGKILKKFKEELGIEAGETSADRLFSLEGCRCLGACSIAPVVDINGNLHGNLRIEDIPQLLESYKKGEKEDV